MFNKKHYINIILWLSIFNLLFTCSRQDPPPPDEKEILPLDATPTVAFTRPVAGDTLQILFQDAPTTLNPHLSSSQKDHQVTRIFLEPLATFDKEGGLIPVLAAEIPTLENGGLAPDGKSVTWKLRPDIRWSDDHPFTAADVVFTYDFANNPTVKADSKIVYDQVATVTALDDYTVQVNFKQVNPTWFLPFVGIYGTILPEHKFEAYNGPNAREAPANISDPVGTGPYRVLPPGIKPQEILFLGTQLIETVKIIFAPNPHFREADKPYFSQIVLRGGGTANEAARLSLQTGEVDYAWNIALSSDELATFETAGQGVAIPTFGSSVEHFEVNWTDPNRETAAGERSSLEFGHPFFQDDKVRQALAYAVDRQKIAALYGDLGRTTNHILAAPSRYKSETIFYEFDLQKAATLLDEAGWVDSDGDGIRDKEGRPLSILFQGYTSSRSEETQNIIREALEEIQVDVTLKTIETSIFFGSDRTNPNHNGRFLADAQVGGWTSLSPDPSLFLAYWTCAEIPQKANGWTGLNFRRWCNPAYDALYQAAATELDPEKRDQLLRQMNDMLTAEVVTIPLVDTARISGISRNLAGYNPTPWDAETWNIKDWRRSDD